jgi:CDGSH-type Zn-finger protein
VTCPPTSGDATIEVAKNGPYRLRGAIRLCDSNGEDVAARGTLVLCRCGNSSKKPFCDGTHRKTGFDGARLTVGPADGTLVAVSSNASRRKRCRRDIADTRFT